MLAFVNHGASKMLFWRLKLESDMLIRSSRDLQLHIYGPPKFTEADVLACMNRLEDKEELD